jgi:hypothetical protein
MQTHRVWRNGLVFVIIMMFTGMSFVSSTGCNANVTQSHDVGVEKIIQPVGPAAPWSPGVYPIKALLENNDYVNGATFNVTAIILWFHESGNVSLYYQDTKAVTMTPHNSTTVVFDDVAFHDPGPPGNGRGKNVSYRLEIITELVGDDNPDNNQKTLDFIICYLETDYVDFKLYGTQQHGWYAPGAWLVIFYNSSIIPALYYEIDGSGPILYTGPPIYIEDDGHHILYIFIGNETVLGPYAFKTDGTPPTINYFSATRLNKCGTKWNLNATVSDATSGVALVEFYINDEFVGNVTSPPYILEIEVTLHFKCKTFGVIAYDNAGNSALEISPPAYETTVHFCCGRISHVQEIQSGSAIVGYRFEAVNVLCTTGLNSRPVVHHFHNHELLSISFSFRGIFDQHTFICGWGA